MTSGDFHFSGETHANCGRKKRYKKIHTHLPSQGETHVDLHVSAQLT